MKKTFIILFLNLLFVKFSDGQTFDVFDTKLYSEKLTMCDLISKFIDESSDFKYTYYDTSFFSISSDNHKGKIFGTWSFVLRGDSLDQIDFSSLDLAITQEWYNLLYKQADSLIKLFTIKYGPPLKSTTNQKNFYQNGKKYLPGDIIKAIWLINGQKLKVEFTIEGEHKNYYFMLRISKFKDYYGNHKVPLWWGGI